MPDPRHTKLAGLLVGYCTSVRPGDLVAISAEPAAMPMIEAIYAAVLKAGGHPFWVPKTESLDELRLAEGTREQLEFVSPVDLHRVDAIDVQIGLWAEQNTRFMGSIDPKRSAMAQSARKPFMQRFFQRAAEGTLRWVGTQYPTLGSAQDAGMSLRAYEDFVYGAGLLHLDDPEAAWRAIGERQQRVCDFLSTKRELRFIDPPANGDDGTDLIVDIDPARAVWVNCAGQENFPDGEVFTGPQGVDGHVNYRFPAVYNGQEVEGVRLAFKGGRVVDASARKNEAFLIEMLDQDDGARNLGEIAIGTNYGITKHTRNTLFDEKIGGTFHAAVGAGYPESGSDNESGLHWDMVCDLRTGGRIEADGETFHENGMFLDPDFPRPE